MEILVALGLLLICMLCILLAVMIQNSLRKQKKDMRDLLMEAERKHNDELSDIKQHVNHDLLMFQNSLLQSLQSDMNTLNENTSKKLVSIEQNVNHNLTYGFDATHKVFTQVMNQMGKIDESTKHLQEISGSIASLQSILNDKKTRGIYGEIELYSLLESVMGAHPGQWQRQYKLSSGVIVDAVLFGAAPGNMICIDSKFPLENYNRLIQEEVNSDVTKLRKEFASDVKKHIKAIHDKYIIHHETAEFAYMFIPAEAIFSYLHANMQDVIQFSYEQKVFIVSPTTLMAYLTAIKALYIDQLRSENIAEIQGELKKLSQEFERFEKRYTSIQSDFEHCYNDMRSLGITANKIMMRFASIQDVELHQNERKED